ncbi:MAG TPA: polysaccharide pyruvyl transferase family protein [Caulobacteraceae bacterium]
MRAVLLNDTRSSRHHGCDAVVRGIFSLCAERGISITATAAANLDWRDQAPVLEAIEAADLVIVNGEGTIHHDAERGRILLTAAGHARERGKASALINATWEANGAPMAALAAGFDLVSVRDNRSAAELRAHGVACRVTPDLALLTQVDPADRGEAVLYTDNVVAARALELYRLGWSIGARPLSIFHHKRSAREALQFMRRYAAAMKPIAARTLVTAERAGWDDIVGQVDDFAGWTRRISRAGLVITGRFHVVALCLATATPFLATPSNTHKIEALIEDAGLEPWRVGPVEAMTPGLIERGRRWTSAEAGDLGAFLASARERMRALFGDISALR